MRVDDQGYADIEQDNQMTIRRVCDGVVVMSRCLLLFCLHLNCRMANVDEALEMILKFSKMVKEEVENGF